MMTSRVSVPDPFMFGPWWGLGLVVCDWGGEIVYAHDGSTIGQNARLRILPDSDLAIAMLTNGGPRDDFYRQVFNTILGELGAATIPDLPKPDPGCGSTLPSTWVHIERPGVRYEIEAAGDQLRLTFVRDPGKPEFRARQNGPRMSCSPIDETHFLMPAERPPRRHPDRRDLRLPGRARRSTCTRTAG